MILTLTQNTSRDEVRSYYSETKSKYSGDMDQCIHSLLMINQLGLIRYLQDMDNLTTVETQYISSLLEDKNHRI